MKTITFLPKSLFVALAALISFSAHATVYTTTSNNTWSPSNSSYFSGNTIGNTLATDTFIIRHDAELKGIHIFGTVIIEDDGKMKPEDVLRFEAGSSITVMDGGKLEVKSQNFFNYSTSFQVDGEFKLESANLYNYGDINVSAAAKMKAKSFAMYHYGTATMDGKFEMESGSFYGFSGSNIVLNNKTKIKSAGYHNYSGATITGFGYIDYDSGSMNNAGSVNGCSGNNCVSSDPTYLANVPSNSNFVVYKNGSFPNTDCNTILYLRKNYDVNSNITVGTIYIVDNKKIKIKKNKSLTVCSALVNQGKVEIEDKGALVQTSSSNLNEGGGIYKIKREGTFSDNKYNTWSSPISNANINEIFSDNNPCDIYAFDGSAQNWKYDYADGYQATCNGNPVTFSNGHLIQGGDGVMDAGRGYFATGGTSQGRTKREFEGTANNGPINVPVYTTNLGNNPNWTGDDWNLVGNPYASAIDVRQENANSFINQNASKITGDLYFWIDDNSSGTNYNQSSDYATYNNMGGVSANGSDIPTGFIASGQGFWVVATQTSNVLFNNEMRVAGNNDKFFKTASQERTRLWFDLTNDANNFNQVLIGFDENATDSYDQGLDAPKAEGTADAQFATKILNENYSIQALEPLVEGDEKMIELMIQTNNPGHHVITLSKYEFLENYKVLLIDLETGKEQNIVGSPYVTYLDTAGKYEQRFYVKIKRNETIADNTTSINDIDTNEDLLVHDDQNFIYVNAVQSNSTISTLNLYSTLGKLIKSKNNISLKREQLDKNNLANGIYVLTVELEDGSTYSKKLFIGQNQ